MWRLDLSPVAHRRLFWASAVAAVLLSAWLSRYDRDLRSSEGAGIVDFELAGSGARAEAILCSWRQTPLAAEGPEGAGASRTGVDQALASLRLDFLFLLIYPLAVGLGCREVAVALERRGVVTAARGGRFLRGLAWAQVATAVLDATENVALLRVIARFRAGERVGDALPALARWCAIPKFALVSAGLLAVLAGLVVIALGREPARATTPARPDEGAARG